MKTHQIPGFYHNSHVLEQCKPFALEQGASKAVILVHGFTGNPADFRDYAQFYFRAGYDVYVPLLPGHGSHISYLERITYKELYIPFPPLVRYVKERYEQVHLVGLSYGSIPSTQVAMELSVDTLSFFAPAFYLIAKKEKSIGLAQKLRLPMFKGRIAKEKTFDDDDFSYRSLAIKPAIELHNQAREIRTAMRGFDIPVFHAHGDADQTTSWQANHLFLKKALPNYYFYKIAGGIHVLPRDRNRETLAQKHIQWIEEQSL